MPCLAHIPMGSPERWRRQAITCTAQIIITTTTVTSITIWQNLNTVLKINKLEVV